MFIIYLLNYCYSLLRKTHVWCPLVQFRQYMRSCIVRHHSNNDTEKLPSKSNKVYNTIMNYLQGSFMNKKSFRTLSSLAIAIATVTSGAYAAELEEVIVTAQKRAESLQEVPVSLTAISGTKIEEAGMNTFGELSTYVPNLSITENAVNTIIEMRGISVGANQSFEQSVGVFVDGIHYD